MMSTNILRNNSSGENKTKSFITFFYKSYSFAKKKCKSSNYACIIIATNTNNNAKNTLFNF